MKPQYYEHGRINEGIVSKNIIFSENTIMANVYGIAAQGYDLNTQLGELRRKLILLITKFISSTLQECGFMI